MTGLVFINSATANVLKVEQVYEIVSLLHFKAILRDAIHFGRHTREYVEHGPRAVIFLAKVVSVLSHLVVLLTTTIRRSFNEAKP